MAWPARHPDNTTRLDHFRDEAVAGAVSRAAGIDEPGQVYRSVFKVALDEREHDVPVRVRPGTSDASVEGIADRAQKGDDPVELMVRERTPRRGDRARRLFR